MAERTRYKTKQKDQLTAYLRDRSGVHVTAAEMADGLVRKYIIGATGSACYEYVGERADDMVDCFHCKCEKCGKLIHLHCDELKELQRHIDQKHGFVIDPMMTVFYGICDNCRIKIHA